MQAITLKQYQARQEGRQSLKQFILFTLLISSLSAQVRIPGPGGSGASAAVNAIGPADAYTDLACTTATTTLTTGLLNNASCTHGIANTTNYAITGTAPVAQASQTGIGLLGGNVYVDGTLYDTAHTSLAFASDNTATLNYVSLGAPFVGDNIYPKNSGVIGFKTGGIVFGGSNVMDIFGFIGNHGHKILLQHSTTACGGTAGFDLEVVDTIGTAFTSCVSSAATTPYIFTLQADWAGGSGTAKIYDSSFALLGTLTLASKTFTAGESGSTVFWGNQQSGTTTGTDYFQGPVIRWSGEPPYPYGPRNTTQDPVNWGGQSHANHGAGTQTTLATTKTLDVPANWGQVVTVSNENASGAATGVANTAGDTFVKGTPTQTTGNGQSMSQWYACSASSRTAQTYTVTWPTSQFSNIDVQLIPSTTGACPTFDTGAIVNQATGATATTAAFTPSTATGTNVGMCYTQAGLAMTIGANYYGVHDSSADSTIVEIRTNAPNSSQTMAAGNASSGNPSMCVVGNYKQ